MAKVSKKSLKFLTARAHLLIYTVLAFIIFDPSIGYLLTLDMVFTPEITLPSITNPSYPFYLLLKILSFVLPVWVLQKILLVTIFVLAGLGAHKLMAYVMTSKKPATHGSWPYYFAGILYMINPFTYTRLMAGQFAVLLGYALLPFVMLLALKFLRRRSPSNAIRLGGLLAIVAIVSIHTLGLAVLLLACLVITCLLMYKPSKQQIVQGIKQGGIGIVVFATLSSCWLLPLAIGTSKLGDTVSGFSSHDAHAFATQPGDIGTPLNVLALQGFWGDDKNLYLLPQDQYTWWLTPILLLWLLVAVGIYYGIKNQRTVSISLLIVALIGFVLALGTTGTWFATINTWLITHVPFFAGYRELQKFAALIALMYAYFGAFGVALIIQKLHQKSLLKNLAVMLCLILPFICSPLMLFGANGQLKATSYPADWYAMNEYLHDKAEGTRVLFLPWHLYMPFSFTDRVVANPAGNFFNTKLYASKDPELGGASSYSTDPLTTKLDSIILPNAKNTARLATELRDLGISYILLAKEYDHKRYDFLQAKAGITIEHQTPNLVLYRIEGNTP
ncbi:MAG: hypothetical protein WBP26_00240 [Candidatus Saccharimonadales bacterium]